MEKGDLVSPVRELVCPVTSVVGNNIADTVIFRQPVMLVDNSGKKIGNKIQETAVNFAECGIDNLITRRGLVASVEMGIFSAEDLNKILVADSNENTDDRSFKGIFERAFGNRLYIVENRCDFRLGGLTKIYRSFPVLRGTLIGLMEKLEGIEDIGKGLGFLDTFTEIYISNRVKLMSQVTSEFNKNRNVGPIPEQLVSQVFQNILSQLNKLNVAYATCFGNGVELDEQYIYGVINDEAESGWRLLKGLHKNNPGGESPFTSSTRRTKAFENGNVFLRDLVDPKGNNITGGENSGIGSILKLNNGDIIKMSSLYSCPFFEHSYVME